MWSLLIFHWGEHCSTLSQLAPSWPSQLTPMIHFGIGYHSRPSKGLANLIWHQWRVVFNMKSRTLYNLIKTLKRQNFTFFENWWFCVRWVESSNMWTKVFPDAISVFACYLTMQVAQSPEHAPSQLTPRPNLPRSPLWSYWRQRYRVG